tara:strand:+ start:341 stop:670 length:330 start_codon:yes stop_codon:yes gene_type:complete
MKGGGKPASRVNAYLFAKTWRMFADGRHVSAHDLVESLEVATRTAWLWLRTLHEMRCIHVVDWKKDTIGRDQTPVYADGDGFDKPKYKRTLADRRRQYYDKKEEIKEPE